MPDPARSAGRQLAGLEAGRGVASLLVVAVHTWDHCAQAYGWFGLGWLFTFGHAGVDFFFVLSGFIILHVHGRDIGRPARLPRYAERRLTRIYPLYWIGLLMTLAVLAAGRHAMPGAGEIAVSAALLPTVDMPVLSVAWTLQHEMLFYALFALLIANRRLGLAAFAAWFALLLAAAAAPAGSALADPAWGVGVKLTSYFDFEFFFGMAVAWFCSGRTVPAPWLVLGAGAALFAAVGLAEDLNLVVGPAALTHLGYGLGATLMVLGLVGTERAGRLRVPRALAVLGGASYAIYLTHLLSVGTIWQALLATHLAPRLPGWVAFLVLVAGACAVGTALSVAVERPLLAWMRRRLARPPAAAVTAPPVGP